ncbi:threonine/serine exporter family protein [Anaerobranca gottschalkii]|uniref:Uncharacterized membrane protein YjjB, DUF3815 family n=1 Tax=Anaerobranca gottschalkii DSM 13577 TaxID=1120990 RepID=A0A1I0BZM9_9FIRM|nr:threonine/serine exporter family protein [Anaerobranca gottschalkii]SET12535.1 Uncharacterized membrane protein YjjB, DUF3815 family [Anaerobranca gottschalkii DSM 13577]
MLIENFIFSLLATWGYCVVFNVPKRFLLLSSLGGAFGWMGYITLNSNGTAPVTAAFAGAAIVAIWGEILSVKLKDIVTLFFIPGIVPLVPGAGMYYTMLAIIEKDFAKAAIVGSETLFVAGAIASGLITVSSISRIIRGKK